MLKQDFIYTDRDGHKIRVVSLSPDKPKRVLLIPSLVGANAFWAIKTFRSFLRGDCILVSFDYCGHCKEVGNEFSLSGTLRDTRAALTYGIEYSRKNGLAFHVGGACFGLIPLIHSLNDLGWPQEVRSMLSVNGLLGVNDILKLEDYLIYLRSKGLTFKNKADFVSYISTNKKEFIRNKSKYIDGLTEYLLVVFEELSEIISYKKFGALEYSKVDFYNTFCEFMINDWQPIKIQKHLPCLFFAGAQDEILNLKGKDTEYSSRIKHMTSQAKILNINVDHFGRGKEHYRIPQEGIKFMIRSELCRS